MGIILSLLGWEKVDEGTYHNMDKYKRSVMVFPHTSRMEFLLYISYFFRYDPMHTRCKTLINDRFMRKWGFIFKYFGCMKSPAEDFRNNGGCKKIIEELESYEEFTFCISPKGTIYNRPWRSGYYHIAKHFNCPIIPAGFDYETHRFIAKEPIFIRDMSEEECRLKLQDELKDIVPLNPELSEFPLECIGRYSDPTVMPPLNSSLFVMLVITILIIMVMVSKRLSLYRGINKMYFYRRNIRGIRKGIIPV